MSEIDGMFSVLLGLFYGVPLYQPLEEGSLGEPNPQGGRHVAPPPSGPNCGPGKLVLGGGHGEHPALIFHDVEHCVARYLVRWHKNCRDDVVAVAEQTTGDTQTLEYCEWRNETHRSFYRRCECDYGGHDDTNEDTFEGWLILNIGEFVYLALPDFTSRIREWRDAHGDLEWLYVGVTLPPPGYRGGASIPRPDGSGYTDNYRWEIRDRWPGYHRLPPPEQRQIMDSQ